MSSSAAVDDIISSLEGDAPVRDLRVCVRATAVWSRRLGLAYTFPRIHRGHASEKPRKKIRDMSARELAELARSEDTLDAAVGFAAASSLLDPAALVLERKNAHELILERGEGKDVTVVGHFPFVKWLRERVRNLFVLELSPREDDLPASSAAEVIPRSDVVAITGTSLINHTVDPLLALARSSFTIVLGPSTPLTPVLFDHGVDAICGSVVVDPDEALRGVSEGESFRYIGGLEAVTALRPGA